MKAAGYTRVSTEEQAQNGGATMNEPQEPRTLRAILDDLKCTRTELEHTLNSLENTLDNSMNSPFWKIKLLLLLAVVGFTILVLVVLWQR